jgi:stringent starvation protein B
MGRSQDKRKIFEQLLGQGIATLHLDARRPGVIVPVRHTCDEWLVLNYSYRYGIADFTFDDVRVFASLSFQGRPVGCSVPWEAVFAITDATRTQGLLWRDDLPPEVQARLDSGAMATGATAKKKRATRPSASETADAAAPEPEGAKPGLRLLDGGRSGAAVDPQTDKPRKVVHLRRIK